MDKKDMFGWLDDDNNHSDDDYSQKNINRQENLDSSKETSYKQGENFFMSDPSPSTESKDNTYKHSRNRYESEYRNKKLLDEDIKTYIDEEVKKKTKKRFGFLKALALVLVGSLLGSMITMNLPDNKTAEETPVKKSESQAVNISTKDEYNVESAVAKKSIPSVVGIQVNVIRAGGFFGDEVIQGQAIGSGVVVSEDGYILTNAHVINDAKEDQEVDILFHNNDTAKAKVLWKDTTLDLAMIKANKSGLTPMQLGDSSKVEVGDKAIAIGNPVGLNLQSTLTSGFISGTNRSIQMAEGVIMDGLFQTDAAINSGNSGGALVDSQGRLIGINTAKVQSTDGIGFAIPVNVTKPIIDSFIKNGTFQSVQLGISGINLDVFKQHYGAQEKIEAEKGVVIAEIPQGGNASRSDLKVQDIIVGINGKPIESMNQLKQHLLTVNTGDTVTFNVYRNNKKIDVKVEFKPNEPNI